MFGRGDNGLFGKFNKKYASYARYEMLCGSVAFILKMVENGCLEIIVLYCKF